MSNYDKFHALMVKFGYKDSQIDELWEMIKQYDKRTNNIFSPTTY